MSPFLNVYCEPAAYLTEAERRVFEPVVFYGSLPALEELEASGSPDSPLFEGDASRLKIFVSFGTVVWRYWPQEALDALQSIAGFLGGLENASGLIGVAGTELGAEAVRSLTRPNVSVASFVDQWQALKEADLFFTHNGLSSTHEAIFHGVPMISYPFFADQPELAELCRSFGLAIPLTDTPRSPVTAQDLQLALAEFTRSRESLQERLAQAREWEWQTIRNRDSVHEQIIDLIEAAASPS